jgi:glucokinase
MVDEKRRDMGTNKPNSDETAETFSLIADIGGTNARFALATADGRITRARTLACADYRDPAHAARAYLDEEGQSTPAQACFAFACPTHEDRIRMTNNVWDFSRASTKEQLGLQRLEIINDFTALALALPRLPVESLRQVGGTRQEGKLPVGVVGPGTGLGVSGLIPHDGGWIPLVSEGGHASLAVSGPREIAVLEYLERLYGRVSAERVLSGPGIKALYQTLCALDRVAAQDLTPAEITERGTAGEDGICREALEIFCALLGDFAGDFALTLGARGGVYIGGGIVPHLGDFFARSAFRKRFEDKGRLSSYVAAIPCYVISADYPALIGAAACLAPVPNP